MSENKSENKINSEIQKDYSQESIVSSPRKNSKKKTFWVVLFIVIAFYVGVAWGKKANPIATIPSGEVSSFIKNLSNPKELFVSDPEKNKPDEVDFNLFWEAWKKVDQKYVDEGDLNPQERVYGSIRGMIGALGDPYSGFMDPSETKDFNTDMEGSFEGIGAELGMKEGILTVIAPIEGMPAEKAGLRAGDKILKINEEVTADITIDEAVKKIRGEKGTNVTLTVMRNGDGKTQDITITRGKIEIKSVTYEQKEDGIAYVRIKKFSEDTSNEFNRVIAQMIADNTKGIVLDMRNNPGGFLSIAVEMASKFVPKGEPVVWEEGRDGQRSAYKALGGDSLSEIPVLVLINEGSASASEILAGALRDLKGHVIVGKKSFGKGSVQQLDNLEGGSSLRITIAKWLTPSGQSIHEVGLEPDIKVDISNEDYDNDRDPQLDRALEEIKNKIQ